MTWIRDDDINKIFEHLLKQMNTNNTKSWSYGYSMTPGPDGKPVIREWGNKPDLDNPLKPQPYEPDTPEPLSQVDIDTENMKVRVIVEIPGFTREQIKITGQEDKLTLSASNENNQTQTKIPIDAKIDPKSAKATYKNGILDITIDLLEPPKGDSVDIQIN